MTFSAVLDASAAIAFLNQEPGFELVKQHLATSCISAVNFAEVITVLINFGMVEQQAVELANNIFLQVIPFDQQQASQSAQLRNLTKALGLSLGDRACLALALSKNLPVLTADQVWQKLDLAIDMQIIR